jgi:fibronectin type 3 domain-containing protein/O-glycosyl hydrolase
MSSPTSRTVRLLVATTSLVVLAAAGLISSPLPHAQAASTVTVNAAQKYQAVQGLGVNVNVHSWNGGQLKPALDQLTDQLGASAFRVVIEQADWEATNDDADPSHFNWDYYNQVYETAKFTDLWNTLAYLSSKHVTVSLNVMGPLAAWMGGSTLSTSQEAEWVEMMASLVYYARVVKHLDLTLFEPFNEPDWTGTEGARATPDQVVRVAHQLAVRLDGLGLGDVKLILPDTANVGSGLGSYFSALQSDSYLMGKVAALGLHDYSGSTGNAASVIQGSAYPGLPFWMNEFSAWCSGCDTGAPNPADWSLARTTAQYLMNSLAQGAAGAEVWEGYDSYYEHHSSWSYWGLLAYDQSSGTYTPRKSFYAMEQLMRFIPPGSVRIAASSDNGSLSLLAFQDPASGRVTLVGRNTSSSALTFTGTVAGVDGLTSLASYSTNATLDAQAAGDVPVAAGAFSTTIPADTLFTLTGVPGPANAAPSVSLTAPTNGATFTAPATVDLAATAADSDGTVTKVDFYDGSTLLGTSTSAPYAYSWANVPAGPHTLSAKATDNAGATTTSAPVAITVTAPSTLPTGWSHGDVGAVGVSGDASYAGGTFTVSGSGADIWGTSDAFHFAYLPLTGDGSISARITGQTNTDPWARAGVMVRETLAAGSRHALAAITPGHGFSFTSRSSAGGTSSYAFGGDGTIAGGAWVRVTRVGAVLTGYRSTDGTTWTSMGSVTMPNLAATTYLGLAVSSHANTLLATDTFDDVTAGTGTPDTTPPVISAVSSGTPGLTTAGVTWTTDEAADSQVDYGTTAGYGSSTSRDVALVTAHAQGLSGLAAGTVYHYRVRSTDAAGNQAVSGDFTFTTASSPPLPDTSPPTAPTGLSAVALSGTQVRLTWTASTDDVGVTGYAVARGGTQIGAATATAFTDTTASPGTAYSYTVTARDAAGNVSAPSAPATATTPTTSSLLTTQVPVTAADSDSAAVELGVAFRSSQAGTITGIRFYKGITNTGTHTGSLWSASGARLATATFSGESASGWQTVAFPAGVPVTAGTTYVASYLAPQGHYAVTQSFFTTDLVNGPLTAPAAGNGRYRYGAAGGFPTSTYQASNYFVDVLFQPTPPPPTPTVVAVSPAPGATGVSTTTTVTAALSGPPAGTPVLALAGPAGAIAGTSAFNTATNVVTFTPAAALPLSAVISATTTLAGTPLAGGAWSFTTTSTGPPPDTSPPTAPTGLSAVAISGTQVNLTWTASTDDVGVTGYAIARGGTQIGTATATAFTDATASPGTAYSYTVTARDAAGNVSVPSAPATATTPSAPTLAVDTQVVTHAASAATSIRSPAITTATTNELLVAFVSSDGPAGSGSSSFRSVTGGGLTWTLRKRVNTQAGTSEIWTAPATVKLTAAVVTATRSGRYRSSIVVVAFTGASLTSSGATGGGAAATGAPTASLTTTRAGSWVWAVGNDWDNAIARTVGAGQTKVDEYLAPVGDTLWVQRQTSPTPLTGTTVTINDTTPTADRWNLALIEILPAP